MPEEPKKKTPANEAPALTSAGTTFPESQRNDNEPFPYFLQIGDVYDGPLDLLLALIKKQNLDIWDLPVFVLPRFRHGAIFMVWVKQSHAQVIQKGRFANDETLWNGHLSAPKVRPRRKANDLSFALNTSEDFKFFQDTMEQKIAGFHWTSAEADGDEGEENADEDQELRRF